FLLTTPAKNSQTIDSLLTENGTIFAPRTLGETERVTELKLIRKRLPLKKSILAGPFLVGPDDFRYSGETVLSIRPDSQVKSAINVAICRFSDKDDEWDWFDTVEHDGVYTAIINRNGVYALIIDKAPPIISSVSPRNSRRVKSKTPTLTATIEDKLSGIWVDTLFDIRLDGEWLIPEYDAEDHILRTKPNHPLKPGSHNLVITVRDNAGNKARRSVKFIVE
ncbi:MAG: hypothetical protein IIB00_06230, partial [candidate division Zixibacteria bacterium]|nr:hypothetical protein [candidate division Zixibacteria bacterium]